MHQIASISQKNMNFSLRCTIPFPHLYT